MNPIRAILFDWGGVLIDDPAPALARYCADALGVALADFSPAHLRHERPFQEGRIEEREFWERVCRDLGVALPARDSLWRDAFFAAYRPRPSMWDLVRRVRNRRCATALLSNTERPAMSRLTDADRACFDQIVASCQVGLAKPDARIYRLALERLGCSPAQAIFIDDKPEYVRGAADVGIGAILYRDEPALRDELRGRGVL